MSYVNTYKGEKIGVNDMSHQHVSNWIHYSKHVVPSERLRMYFQAVLDVRFNGELLPYRPHANYTFEIETLKDNGMIQTNGNIVEFLDDGAMRKIGEVFYETEKEDN